MRTPYLALLGGSRAFNIEDLLHNFVQMDGGGGGHHQQEEEVIWPRGVTDECDRKFNWLKGTTWEWNNWRKVKFEKDGAFEVTDARGRPMRECARRQCVWTADAKQVYVHWSSAGLHTVKPKVSGDGEACPGSKYNTLLGSRNSDGERVRATFSHVHDSEAAELEKDLYELMGLEPDATSDQINKVYRKAAKQYHPDKCREADCAKKFNDIRDANEILSAPDKKILYDTGGMAAIHALAKGEGVQRGRDHHNEISVRLPDLYLGNTVNAQMNRRVVCVGCHLPAYANSARCRPCGRCPNEQKTVMLQMGPGMFVQQQQEVPSKHKCKMDDAPLEVTIEKGMDNGSTISFPYMGEQRPGWIPGSVVFIVKTVPHPVFERKGKNLWMTMHLTLVEALLGFEKTVDHLDGHVVKVKRSGVTRPEFVMKIADEGMPVHNVPTEIGILFVKFVVDYPEKLTAKQQRLMEEAFGPSRDEL